MQKRTAAEYEARGREILMYSGGEGYRKLEAESFVAAGEKSQNPLARAMATQVRTQIQNGETISNETLGRFENVLKNSSSQNAMDAEQAVFILSQELLGENAPATFEEFQAIKTSDPAAWKEMNDKFEVWNLYEIDGDASVQTVLNLDQYAWNNKQTAFDDTGFTGSDRKDIRSMKKTAMRRQCNLMANCFLPTAE